MSAFQGEGPGITVARARELIDSGAVQLVDVRTDEEWEAGRITGSTHIGFERLPTGAATIERDRPVLFVCRAGGRSDAAAQAFIASGYEALSLTGGLLDWVEAELPLEPADGHVAEHR